MPCYKVIYKSQETIIGHPPKSDEWIQYTGLLQIRDGGKTPVTLDMTFDPPHPFALSMPETHSIKATSVSADAYVRGVKFFERYSIEFS